MLKMKIAQVLLLASVAGAAVAGPLDEAMANAHMKAVAAGDVESVVGSYAEDATLYWVGGQLDGIYRGAAEIRDVWARFVKANDGKPREATIGKVEQSANPKGATVMATADYQGKARVKVRHVLVYRDGKLVNEIWQIDPNLQIAQNH